MGMEVRFSNVDDVVVIEYEDAVVDSDAAFEVWRRKVIDGLQAKFEELGGRFPLAVDIDGLRLSRRFGARYSAEVAAPAANNFLSAIARYGASGRTTAVIAIEALNRANMGMSFARDERFTSNVFANRDEAIDFLRTVAPGVTAQG